VQRKSVSYLHANASHLFALAEKDARVPLRRLYGRDPVRFVQMQSQHALQPRDVLPNANAFRRARVTAATTIQTQIEQRVAHDLAWPMIRELTASLGEHKVCAEGGQSRAFGCGFGLGLAPPGCIYGPVLEKK
jgi:hypothetical protein